MKKILIIGTLFSFLASTVQASDRTWVLDAKSLVSILISNKVKPEVGSSYDLDSQDIYISFGYNFEKFETGPILTYYNLNAGAEKSKLVLYGGYFKYNFIPNTTSEKTIPFIKGTVLVGNKTYTSGNSKSQFNWVVSGGATFFPLNDNIGIDAALSYTDSKAGDIPGKTSGFALATAFNLYF